MSDELVPVVPHMPHMPHMPGAQAASTCGRAETLAQLEQRVAGLEQRASAIELRQSAYETAYILDDLGRPGFDDHRRDHRLMRKTADTLDGYKQDGAKTILKIVISAVLALMLLGVGEWLRGKSGGG